MARDENYTYWVNPQNDAWDVAAVLRQLGF